MKKIGMLLALLAGALLAAQAHAQASGQFYFGGGGGATFTDARLPTAGTQTEDTKLGAKVYFGAVGENFGWEVTGYHLGKRDITVAGTGVKFAEAKAFAIAMSGVMSADLGGGYVAHAKLGLAITQTEYDCPGAACGFSKTTKRGNSGVVGVGVGARIARNLEARLDWEHIGAVHHAAGTTEFKNAYDMYFVSVQLGF